MLPRQHDHAGDSPVDAQVIMQASQRRAFGHDVNVVCAVAPGSVESILLTHFLAFPKNRRACKQTPNSIAVITRQTALFFTLWPYIVGTL